MLYVCCFVVIILIGFYFEHLFVIYHPRHTRTLMHRYMYVEDTHENIICRAYSYLVYCTRLYAYMYMYKYTKLLC